MCLIIVSPSNSPRPSKDILEASKSSNSHGNGIAWNDGRRVHYRKGISDKQEKEYLADIPRTATVVVHHRLATVGESSPALCHPFVKGGSLSVSGSCAAIMAHNGHLTDWRKLLLAAGGKIPVGPWSDSRAIAYLWGRCGDGVLDLFDERTVALRKGSYTLHGTGWHTLETGLVVSNLGFQARPMMFPGLASKDAIGAVRGKGISKRECMEPGLAPWGDWAWVE